jgi:hypothetical protein
LGVVLKKATALCECYRVRLHCFNRVEVCTGAADQMLFDLDDDFVEDRERARLHQIDRRLNNTRDRVFDGRKNIVSKAFVEAAEEIREGFAWYEFDLVAEQLHRSLFTERASLSLERHSWFSNQHPHCELPQLRYLNAQLRYLNTS